MFAGLDFGFRRILFVAMDTRRGRLRQDLVRVREVKRWKILRKPRKRTQNPRYNDLKWCSFPISMGGFLRWICICWKWMFFLHQPTGWGFRSSKHSSLIPNCSVYCSVNVHDFLSSLQNLKDAKMISRKEKKTGLFRRWNNDMKTGKDH